MKRQISYSYNEGLRIVQEEKKNSFYIVSIEIFLSFVLGLIIGLII